jgi:phospholipid/cholesterol/gamma-HCH transport system substrate-binding protein
MIISALVRKQLIAFTIASVLGIAFLSVVFLRIPEALGWGRYDVTAEFEDGAGLYEGAQVNYLGTPVGKVRSLDLAPSGISVTMSLKDGVTIPSDVGAQIHSVSAVGEQYVELVPAGGAGSARQASQTTDAALRQGDRIDVDRTSSPVEIGPVLDNVARLVDSVPRRQLGALLAETSVALRDRDQDLGAILDGSEHFLQAADAAYPQTRALLRDGGVVLSTLNQSGGHIDALTRQLASVTEQLKLGDADLRALLTQGPGFVDQTTRFIRDVGPSLPGLLAPLNTVASVLATYRDHVAQLLSDYPTALSLVQSVTLPELGMHAVRLTLANANKPPECTEGFLPVDQWRLPGEVGPAYTPLYYCSASHDDTRAVRGARNIPCPNDPGRREPTPTLCKEN